MLEKKTGKQDDPYASQLPTYFSKYLDLLLHSGEIKRETE